MPHNYSSQPQCQTTAYIIQAANTQQRRLVPKWSTWSKLRIRQL